MSLNKNLLQISEILKQHTHGRLGLCDPETLKPYVIPMNFGFTYSPEDKKMKIFMHGGKKGKKIDILKKNNRVCFEVDVQDQIIDKGEEEACKWSIKAHSIIFDGKMSIVEDADEKAKGLTTMMNQCAFLVRKMESYPKEGELDFKYNPKTLAKTLVFEMEVEEAVLKTKNKQ